MAFIGLQIIGHTDFQIIGFLFIIGQHAARLLNTYSYAFESVGKQFLGYQQMDPDEIDEIDEEKLQNAEAEDEEMETTAGNPQFRISLVEGNGLPEDVVDNNLHIFPSSEREEESILVPMVLAGIKGKKALLYFLCV